MKLRFPSENAAAREFAEEEAGDEYGVGVVGEMVPS